MADLGEPPERLYFRRKGQGGEEVIGRHGYQGKALPLENDDE